MLPAGAQVPGHGQIFLDHVGWFVDDLEAAGRVFERLGFVPTPVTVHENRDAAGNRVRAGTANRCAMIARGYIEILAAVEGIDNAITGELRGALARHAGIHLIAFTCADAAGEAARLEREGFAPLPAVALRRPVETDAGTTEEAAFSVIRLPPGTIPEGRIQMLSQETPEIVWQPSLIARDNAVALLSGVVTCSEDPDEATARFSRFTGRPAEARTIFLDRGRMDFCDPGHLARLLPGARPAALPCNAAVVLESADLARSQAFFAARGLPVAAIADGVIAVPPEAAAGAWMVLIAAGKAWPAVRSRAD